jgi:PAS domain S-box-containing protein
MPQTQENNRLPATGQFFDEWQAESHNPAHTAEQVDTAKRLELALEGGSLGFWDWNVATGVVDYSERWCAMVGYSQKELAPDFSTWEKLVHPEDLPKAVAAIEKYFAGETEQYAIEFRMQHKNGNWHWIASRGRVFEVDAEGNPLRAVGTHQDVTDRKLTELALAQEKDQFQPAMEYSAIGMALVSLKGEWLMVNPAICRIVGYSMEELLATDFQSITHPDDLQSDLGYIERVLAGEIPNYEMEKRYFHKDGRIIWVLLSVSLARNPDGSPRHFISQIQDITERKNAEIRANIYLKELERSNQELDDFAYIASHDLKEPLRAINNHSQSLLSNYEAELDEAGGRKLNRLVFLTRRMEVLIDDLLQFSRLGRLDSSREDIDLNKLLANEVATLSNDEENPQIRINVCDQLPSIRGNRASIAIVFRNLIGNAIKYNDSAEKIIEVGLLPEMQRKEQTLRNVYYIRDNGIGIDPDFHELIFGMFKRLNNEKAYGPGTGAGLAFVKRIIDQLSGVIFVQSQPGDGATFYFTLGNEL